MFDLKKIIFILFIFFLLSISTASAADQVNITYIGINDSRPTGLTVEQLNGLPPQMLNAQFKYSNVNYVYIPWVGENGGSSEALKNFASSADVANQDVIIFDMYYANDMADIYTSIENNKSANMVIVGARGAADPQGIFTISSDDHLDDILTTRFNNTSTSAFDIRIMNFVFQSYLLEAYVSKDKIADLSVDRLNILYIGFTIPSPEDLYAGTYEFDYFRQVLQKTPYRHYFNKLDMVSYGTSANSVVFGNGDSTDWYSLNNLRNNMTDADIDLGDYDIIIFDGLYNDEMYQTFSPIITEAIEKNILVVAQEKFIMGKNIGGNPEFIVSTWEGFEDFGFFYVPSLLSEPYSNSLFILNDVMFPRQLISSNVDYNGLYELHNVLLVIKNNAGKLSPYANSFSAVPSNRLQLTFPSGEFYHPIAGEYFKTVKDYMDWHKNSSYCRKDSDGNPMPYIGIFGFTVYQRTMKDLIPYIEAKGYNVICFSENTGSIYDNLSVHFIDGNGEPYVDCFISIKNWALNYGNQPEGVRQLEALGVPVIKVVGAAGWADGTMYDKNSGIAEGAFSWMASSSNVDGMLDFIALTDENHEWIADRAIAWADLRTKNNAAKEIAILYYNYPPGKAEIGANYLNVMRSLAGDGAKSYVANPGSDLSDITAPSYKGILRELRGAGSNPEDYSIRFDHLPLVTIKEGGEFEFDYSVSDESLIMNEVNLINLIYAQGINVGSYAPGVLDTMVQQRIDFLAAGGNPDDWWGAELIPVKDYLEWLEHETTPVAGGGNGTMDKKLYDELMTTWGTPTVDGAIPTNTSEYEAWGGMIWKDAAGEINPGAPGLNYIVIPMVKLGNVRLMPEPNRALASDKALDSGTYHSGDLPPTHQYVAFYMWLNRGTGDSTGTGETGILGGDGHWKPDAIVHFGTHGTHEWLPGTSVGLLRTQDWSPVLLPTLPNIYPYIVANVGEGLTAEYRGNALIISHMTPPMIKTQLYDDIIEMETAIRGYQKQAALGSGGSNDAIMAAYREIIINHLFELGWQDAFPTVLNNYKTEIAKTKYSGNTAKVTNDDLKEYIAGNKAVFDPFLEDHLHNFVEAIRENSLSYGMHTYGSFDETQIAPMVWNMWSRQGLDDVLLATYFDDVTSIPTDKNQVISGGQASDTQSKYDESDILYFVTLVSNSNSPTADDLRVHLKTVFTQETGSAAEIKAKEDKVIYFLLGPSAYLSDSSYTTGAEIVAAWKLLEIDGVSVYDSMVEEFFEFYFYFIIPENLRGTSGKYMDTEGHYLDAAKMETAITAFATEVRTSGVSYQTVEKGLAGQFNGNKAGRSWYNDRPTFYVLGNNRIAYADSLRATGVAEMNALKEALNGGYITPSSGNDPVLNPHVLPTGRNFYGVDPSTYSTPAAWKVGKAMGEQLLIGYYKENGEFPSTVSFMRFGVDFIQDEGTLEACLFYLLGCEPTWEYSTQQFRGATPVVSGDSNYDDMFKLTINGQDVYRPRVDVVYNSAGMRDGYGSMLRHIDRAVKAVARLDNSADKSGVTNNIKKNVEELSELLKDSGLSQDDIWELATSRVFAQQLGQYEIGTGNLIGATGNFDMSDPDTMKTITDTYLAKMGFLYTEKNWGGNDRVSSEQIQKMLQALLGRTDASIFASAGNLYDSLDNDDVFQYFGAMNMVSSMYDRNGDYISDPSQWKVPQTFIADTSNIHNYKDGKQIVYTAAAYIQKDLAARYLNDAWIEGQMKEGYSGAMMYAEVMQNLYGWSVVTNGEMIGQETWNRVFEKYQSEDMLNHLSHTSPYALQSITGSMIESVRMGYWDASDEQLKQLMQNYVQSVIDAGVACCHHTCGNPTLDKFIAGQMSVLGLTPEEEEKYWQAVEDATEREAPEVSPSNPTNPPSSSSNRGSGFGTAAVNAGQTSPSGEQTNQNEQRDEVQDSGEDAGIGMNTGVEPGTPVSGFEMSVSQLTSSVRDFFANPSFSSSSIIAIAFVVIVVGAVFYGFRRKGV